MTTTTYAGIALWDVATANLVRTYHCPGNGANDAIFLADKRRIFVAGIAFGESGLVDVATGQWESTNTMIQAQCAALTPAGQSILIASWNGVQGKAQLLASGNLELQHDYATGMDGLVTSVIFSNRGEQFLAVQDCHLGIVNAEIDTAFLFATDTGHILKTFYGPRMMYAIVFSPDEQAIIIGCETGLVYWDVQTTEELGRYASPHGAITCLALAPAGDLLAGGCADGTILVWHWPDLRQICEYHGHAKGVNCVTFIPDGSLLASASSDTTVRLWQMSVSTDRATM